MAIKKVADSLVDVLADSWLQESGYRQEQAFPLTFANDSGRLTLELYRKRTSATVLVSLDLKDFAFDTAVWRKPLCSRRTLWDFNRLWFGKLLKRLVFAVWSSNRSSSIQPWSPGSRSPHP